MRFAPTPEQIAFAAAARDLCARGGSGSAARAAWSTGEPPAALWRGLNDLGLLSLLAPEECGGGGSELELVAALVEVGRAAAPGPVVETAAVAVPLLGALAPHLLADGRYVARGISASTSDLMPYVSCGTGLVLEHERLLLVDLTGMEPLEALDPSRAVGRIDNERLQAATTVAEGDQATVAVARARQRAALATAAVLLGLSARAVEMTVEYTAARRQFGVPIGSFQAVKHHLADAHAAVEMARPLVEAAAWALSTGADDAGRLCSMAKARSNSAGRVAAKAALQCHGAIGYTMEADLHLYLMRIWSLRNAWGTTEDHLDAVASTLPLPAPTP